MTTPQDNPLDQLRAQAAEAEIVEVLKTIRDPELPISIWEMGLIYGIDVGPDDDVTIRMTLTTPAYKISGERPMKFTTGKGGVRFEVWDCKVGDFVIGGPNDFDVWMCFESPGGGSDTEPGATGKGGGIDLVTVTKAEFDAHVEKLRAG